MSHQGWQEFLAAEDVADWVVLHGGAMAVFRVASLAEAVRVAEAVADISGLDGAGVLMTIADDQLTVQLTRDMWQLEQRHIHLARAVSAVARTHGAVVDRARVQERCSSPSRGSRMRSMLASGALPSGTPGWPTTTPSTRSATDRRSGCRILTQRSRCDTRCMST
jgi:hypothetical protein